MIIPHPREYPQSFIIAGPYRGNGETTVVYEINLVTNGR